MTDIGQTLLKQKEYFIETGNLEHKIAYSTPKNEYNRGGCERLQEC